MMVRVKYKKKRQITACRHVKYHESRHVDFIFMVEKFLSTLAWLGDKSLIC